MKWMNDLNLKTEQFLFNTCQQFMCDMLFSSFKREDAPKKSVYLVVGPPRGGGGV